MNCGNKLIYYDIIQAMKETKEKPTPAEIGEILSDVRSVGPKKPLGYLPLSTIKRDCGVDPQLLIAEANRQGKISRIFSQTECGIGSGALFVADRVALQKLLSQNSVELKRCGWPDDVNGFINFVAVETAEPETLLFNIVADAFADYENPGRLS